jgi:hypothetical protein
VRKRIDFLLFFVVVLVWAGALIRVTSGRDAGIHRQAENGIADFPIFIPSPDPAPVLDYPDPFQATQFFQNQKGGNMPGETSPERKGRTGQPPREDLKYLGSIRASRNQMVLLERSGKPLWLAEGKDTGKLRLDGFMKDSIRIMDEGRKRMLRR